ncbi:flavin-containing amine oxidoreductase [Cladorrhinum sp. PSN332]|nr:flavin-containing amine oxidoreductase [Cladorrhinum sp. PSN332]
MAHDSPDIAYDAIIVGAGYSGLSAARHLKDAGKKILVLEARDRVGGRAQTINTSDGKQWDVGASFLGKGQDRMFELAKEFGVETYAALGGSKGKTVLQNLRGQTKQYSGFVPPLGLWAVLNAARLIPKFENLIKTANVEEPWKTPNAAELDSITVNEWLKQNCWGSDTLHAMMQMSIEVTLGAHPSTVSMLHAIFFFRAIGSWETACSVENGTQSHLIVGGGQAIANKLYDYLGSEIIHLNEPVTSITYTSSSSVLLTTPLATYTARKTILSIPQPLILEIAFSPPLPAPKLFLLQQTHQGAMGKLIFTYSTPFWLNSSKPSSSPPLRGEATLISLSNHICYVISTSPPSAAGPYKLLAFLAADKTLSFFGKHTTHEERKKVALAEMVSMFGPEAGKAEDFYCHTMLEDKWSGGGGPLASPGRGMWTMFGEWVRKPVGPVHWAGTETATDHYGYMEGAVQAGRRAAGEVLEGL